MWVGSVKANRLFLTDRWNVEHYVQENPLQTTVPEEHPTISLGSLFSQAKEVTIPVDQPDKKYLYIGVKNVECVTGDLIGHLHCVGRDIKTASYIVENGHVLFGRLRPLKNKVYLAENLPANVICSKEFYVLTANHKITPRILQALLSSTVVLDQVAKYIGGATIPRIAYQDLASIKVPSIPIEKQPALEQALLKQDARRATLKAALNKLPSDMESVLTNCWKSHSTR